MISKMSWLVSRLIPLSVWTFVASSTEALKLAYLHADQPSAVRYTIDNTQSLSPLNSPMDVNRTQSNNVLTERAGVCEIE